MNYIMGKIAPLLLEIKPAVLLGVHNERAECGRRYFDLWEQYKEQIVGVLGVSFIELSIQPQKKQIFFFQKKLLGNILHVTANKDFLIACGYESCTTVTDYLSLLRVRYNSLLFPHEIGLLLGYPLKDVKGFMERKADVLMCTGRWRIYDEADHSLRLMSLYAKAEEIITRLLVYKEEPLLFLERIKEHFQYAMNTTMV